MNAKGLFLSLFFLAFGIGIFPSMTNAIVNMNKTGWGYWSSGMVDAFPYVFLVVMIIFSCVGIERSLGNG